MIGLRIESLTKDGQWRRGDYYTATVVNGYQRVGVHNRYGSWQTDDRREVMPRVAAMLAEAKRKLERADKRASP